MLVSRLVWRAQQEQPSTESVRFQTRNAQYCSLYRHMQTAHYNIAVCDCCHIKWASEGLVERAASESRSILIPVLACTKHEPPLARPCKRTILCPKTTMSFVVYHVQCSSILFSNDCAQYLGRIVNACDTDHTEVCSLRTECFGQF